MNRKNTLINVKILPEEQVVHVSQQAPLLPQLLKAGIDISHSCGGMGSCGTCRFYIVEGEQYLSPPTDIETEIRTEKQFSKDERLACQTHTSGSIVIRKPNQSI